MNNRDDANSTDRGDRRIELRRDGWIGLASRRLDENEALARVEAIEPLRELDLRRFGSGVVFFRRRLRREVTEVRGHDHEMPASLRFGRDHALSNRNLRRQLRAEPLTRVPTAPTLRARNAWPERRVC